MRQVRKTKEHKEGFSMGMITMFCASMGTDMFFQLEGFIRYVGLTMMVLSAALVFLYVFRLKNVENVK